MDPRREQASREFRRSLKWIVIAAAVMVVVALVFIASQTNLSFHVVLATVLGVAFSVLLGTGLFALAFFSDKSGHDDNVTDATKGRGGKLD
jgi:hypothetical protein